MPLAASGNSEGEYVSPRLRDLDEDNLPREKLFSKGRNALTDDELIAIFLRTGVRGCNVLELAGKLKKAAGSLSALGQMEAGEIDGMLKGIGKAKAATLAAGFELGLRAARAELVRADMSNPRNVYDYMSGELRFETQEVLCVMMLDARRRLIRMERIAVGTLTRVLVHPRDIFRLAIRYNAFRIILVHNHPSGSVVPSENDKQLTDAVAQAGQIVCIPLMDHVIIGASDGSGTAPYYSFAEHGMLIK